ncbi:MAG: glycosyltransferase [Acidobacteria bacterium]|nr:glycosyltransferase [Acidobacteriota bacterium]MCG2812390.1 glycosyltransferase [Candidatus Aminicenantes bacterium]
MMIPFSFFSFNLSVRTTEDESGCSLHLPPRTGIMKATNMALSVVWINFNGLRLLQEHFASVVDAVRCEESDAEFIVVDNASRDGSLEWLAHNYPHVRLLPEEHNRFFAPAANHGIAAARHNLVLLLNPDVHAVALHLGKVYARFETEERLFAISPRLIDPRDDSQEKLFAYRRNRGTVDLVAPQHFSPEQESPIPYGTGGALFLRRDVFLALGGFREVFAPFYWDDPDLGVRAWAEGWRTIYFPVSRFFHFHSSLVAAWHDQLAVRRVYERNRLLFMHMNLGGAAWRVNYALWLPLRLVRSLLTDRVFWRSWLDFRCLKKQVPAAWRGRRNPDIDRFLVSASVNNG